MPINDALLLEFDQETASTRKVLERCPTEKFGFTPHPKSWTMITLASHIANMLGWTVETMAKDSFDIAPVGAPPYREDPAEDTKALLEVFDQKAAAARAAIAATSDEAFMKPWSLLAGGNVIFTMPRVAVFRSMIMNHAIHHRGQLSLYLRLNDIPVPALYGPSADETGM
jgi:uncharacterized damage-inducible protein DinB